MLFDGTIAFNIAYGSPGASASAIQNAAEAADAHEFIVGKPLGYDTPVGIRGRHLSGGQRQRIALARAFLRDAPILVLDEPLTSLDPETAERILEPLRRLMNGRATLVISHHLELAEFTDEVIVMTDGRVVEQGTHTELLARDGQYSQLRRAGAGQAEHPPLIEQCWVDQALGAALSALAVQTWGVP